MQTLNKSTCHITTQTIDIHSVCPMCGYIFGQLYSKMYKNVVVELSVSLKTFTHTKKDIQKTKIMTFGSITSWQIDGKQWKQRQIFFFFLVAEGGGRWAPKSLQMVTAARKLRHLLLGRKVMTNLDSILKSSDITLPTKAHLVKATVFPIVIYGCKSWTIKKSECWRIDAFERCSWRRLLRVSWTARGQSSPS